MVLPSFGDLQVGRRHGKRLEPVAGEHTLGAGVVEQGLGLQPVQAELPEGDCGGLRYGGAREASAVMRLAHPAADGRRLKGTAGDAVDSDAPDELTALVDYGERHHGLAGIGIKSAFQAGALRLSREVIVGANRIPRGEKLAIRVQRGRQFLRVAYLQEPGNGHLMPPL